MASYYLESSALAKVYHVEPGTERLDALFASGDHQFHVAWLCVVEVHSMAARLVREHKIDPTEQARMGARLDADLRGHAYRYHPLDEVVIDRTVELLATTGGRIPLRTLDALHLAAVVQIRERAPGLVLVTSDRRLANAAAHIGVATLDLTLP